MNYVELHEYIQRNYPLVGLKCVEKIVLENVLTDKCSCVEVVKFVE